MRIYMVWLLFALAALMGTAQAQEIVDIYSNIDSCDVTIEGNAADCTLLVQLIMGGEVLQTRKLALDGPGTYIVQWSQFEAEKGSYDACATLMKNGTALSRMCDNFYYGGITPLRFDVRDFYADSRGMHLSISASDPTIVDIYYMLISGDKTLYVTRDQAVPISGGFATPVQINYAWKQILENDREYTGRVKIVELNHNQTRAFMNSFSAKDDALITETYQDETGASATVIGNSRVPFEGTLRWTLSQNGTTLRTVEKRTPVLLTGDDETIEISWNETLQPGVYQLQTVLMGQGGDVKDLEENIIEAKPIIKGNASETAAQKKSPLASGTAFVALIIAVFLGRRRR
jgi:hypothetical protein